MIVNPVYPNGDDISVVQTQDNPSPYSRYKNLLLFTNKSGYTFYETFQGYNIPSSPNDQFYIVTPSTQNRLDLIAYQFYSLPQLWWAIAYANSITNPLIVPVGTQLRIPAIDTLYSYGGILA